MRLRNSILRVDHEGVENRKGGCLCRPGRRHTYSFQGPIIKVFSVYSR